MKRTPERSRQPFTVSEPMVLARWGSMSKNYSSGGTTCWTLAFTCCIFPQPPAHVQRKVTMYEQAAREGWPEYLKALLLTQVKSRDLKVTCWGIEKLAAHRQVLSNSPREDVNNVSNWLGCLNIMKKNPRKQLSRAINYAGVDFLMMPSCKFCWLPKPCKFHLPPESYEPPLSSQNKMF